MAPRVRSLAALAALAVATVTGAARADLAVILGNGDRATASIGAGGEVETFHFACPASAALAVSVVAKGSPAPKVRVRVLRPDGTVLLEKRSKKVALKSPLAASGTHVVEVSADDGASAADYEVSVRWKSRTKWKSGLAVAPASPGALAFAAARGSLVGLSAARPRSSRAEPAFGTLTGPGGFALVVDAATASFEAPATGDYSVEVVDAGGGAGGKATALATITPPVPAPRLLDVSALTTPDGGIPSEVAYVAPSGIDLPFDLPNIGGVLLSVPSGAVTYGVTILVGPGRNLTPATQGWSVAGPSLSCLPEGTEFTTPIRITLPFDAALARGDPANVAVTVRSDGVTTDLTSDLVVDLGAETCSFPTSHFSEYQVIVKDLVFPPGIVDTTTLPGQTDATIVSGTLGGTFVASQVNLASFSLRVGGDGVAAPAVWATDVAGVPAGAPLWIGAPVALSPSAVRTTFQPNVGLTNGLVYFVGVTNAASVQAGLSGTALTVGVVGTNPLGAPAGVYSGASLPGTAGPPSQDVSSEILMTSPPVTVSAANAVLANGAIHPTFAAGPRSFGGTFTARDVNLVRFTLDVGPRGAAGDTIGVFLTSSTGANSGTNVIWSRTFTEPATLVRLTFEPPPYTVALVSGAKYFIGLTADPSVVAGAGGDGFELRSNPNDPLWFNNPLYEGNALPLATQGPIERTLSTDILMNPGR